MKIFKSFIKAILPKRLHSPLKKTVYKFLGHTPELGIRSVPIDRFLMGGESKLSARKFARLTANPMRPSTPLSSSPHVMILQTYDEIGESLFEINTFIETPYVKNAVEIIGLAGSYFGCKDIASLKQQVRYFIDMYIGNEEKPALATTSHSQVSSFPKVRKIKDSDNLYEIIDGHHRLACAYCKGETYAEVNVTRLPTHTPLQQLLMDGLWVENEKIRYQPIDAPEVQTWPLVRKCSDRGSKILNWLSNSRSIKKNASYIDLGCSYGWFVDHLLSSGYDAYGVERDICAIETGRICYGLPEERIFTDELVSFLSTSDKQYDIVSCFSVLHHFALGKGAISAIDFIKLLDGLTGQALFIDTGQSTEEWFCDSLSEWNPEFIQQWILDNTTFTSVTSLGIDEDNVPPYQGNYGRTFFVCTRDR